MSSPSPDAPARRPALARLGALIAHHPRTWVVAWFAAAVACFAVAVGGVTGESLFQRLHSGEPTVDAESRTVTAATTGGVGTIVHLAASLDGARIAVDDLSLRQPTLDEVFLTLTGSAPDGDGPLDGTLLEPTHAKASA